MADVLVDLGEEWVVDRLAGSGTYSTYVNLYCGWGTGTGTASKSDTGLFTESTDPGSANRVSAAPVTSQTGSLAQWKETVTLSSTSTQTITNAGLFSASGAATMFMHSNFTGIALVSGDSIMFTWTLSPS